MDELTANLVKRDSKLTQDELTKIRKTVCQLASRDPANYSGSAEVCS